MRNEAHRFGIGFHRDKRSQEFIVNELEQIPGIGDKTIQILMKRFKSISRLKMAGSEEIIKIIGVSKADKLIRFFKGDTPLN